MCRKQHQTAEMLNLPILIVFHVRYLEGVLNWAPAPFRLAQERLPRARGPLLLRRRGRPCVRARCKGGPLQGLHVRRRGNIRHQRGEYGRPVGVPG